MATPGRKSKGFKWKFLYVFTGAVDLAQLIMTLTGVGVVISEAIEGIMPFVLIPVLGKTLLTRPQRIFSLVGALGLDAVTGGAAPFWILDIWDIHRDVKKEDAEYNAQQEQEMMLQAADAQALNSEDGVRQPRVIMQGNSNTSTSSSGGSARIINPPLNINGTRRPTGRPLVESKPRNIVAVDFGNSAGAADEQKAA